MSRITNEDVRIWTGHVNGVLQERGKNPINTRQHGYNSLTVIEQFDSRGLPIGDPFFAGTKSEVVTYLQAMYRMVCLLTDETR